MSGRLLLAEDDAQLRDVLARALRAEGLEVRAVGNGSDLIAGAVADPVPDVLIIDIGLPDADGRDVCQALRSRGIWTPVLFLTARDALADRLAGFRAGGDDYVTKPFDIDEVIERLQALLRRAARNGDVASPLPQADTLLLDPGEHRATMGGVGVPLTPTEFRLLAALAARRSATMTRDALVRSAWPPGAIVHDNTLDVYIARLRRKLRHLPAAPTITTVHQVGYRLQ